MQLIAEFFKGKEEKDNFPLMQGAEGKRVEQLQMHLKKYAKRNRNFTIEFKQERGVFGTQTAYYLQQYMGLNEVNEDVFRANKMHENRIADYNE